MPEKWREWTLTCFNLSSEIHCLFPRPSGGRVGADPTGPPRPALPPGHRHLRGGDGERPPGGGGGAAGHPLTPADRPTRLCRPQGILAQGGGAVRNATSDGWPASHSGLCRWLRTVSFGFIPASIYRSGHLGFRHCAYMWSLATQCVCRPAALPHIVRLTKPWVCTVRRQAD